jgi:anthranilate phosphoribosyltransferase
LSSIEPAAHVADLKEDGTIEEYTISPKDLGIRSANEDDLLCRLDKSREALLLLRLLSGQDKGSRRDIVLANTAPILVITGHAADLTEGMAKAADIIDSGRAIKKLRHWVSEQSAEPGVKAERLDLMIESAQAIS